MTEERFEKIYEAARNAFHRKALDEFSSRAREKELIQCLDLVVMEGTEAQAEMFRLAMNDQFPSRNPGLTLIP